MSSTNNLVSCLVLTRMFLQNNWSQESKMYRHNLWRILILLWFSWMSIGVILDFRLLLDVWCTMRISLHSVESELARWCTQTFYSFWILRMWWVDRQDVCHLACGFKLFRFCCCYGRVGVGVVWKVVEGHFWSLGVWMVSELSRFFIFIVATCIPCGGRGCELSGSLNFGLVKRWICWRG